MILEVKDLSFSYEKEILKNVSFKIEEPQFITIIGPNGSGKTTLLKNICGILKHNKGDISIKNSNIKDLSRKNLSKLVAIVNQDQNNIYNYSVEEIIEMGTYVLDLKHTERKDFLQNLYKITDIEDFLDKSILNLSGGEKQRVFITRALAQNSPLVLLDEPISNLDLKHQVDIMELCKNLVKEKNITIISVLHDINFALKYSDKILVMHKGQIKSFGESSKVLTESLIEEVFGQKVDFIKHNDTTVVVPK